jgi:amino acid transporter
MEMPCNEEPPEPESQPKTVGRNATGIPEQKPGRGASRPQLGELSATAICGNDITSSCLYVSAIALLAAGKWAPVALLVVAAVLYLFRSIYGEVVGALPLNGGAYNALLNTTSKSRASLAACLTILSYMATAVISAGEAMHYLHSLWHGLPVIAATVVLLGIFVALTISGISESAVVAIVIFVTHMATLVLLLVLGVAFIAREGVGLLLANLSLPTSGSLPAALFLGFSVSMLGISGFESSANFVEEQKSGVFPRTLRNMWIAVTILNPAMALLGLALVPLADVEGHRNAFLSHMGGIAGGGWLRTLISVDAVLVLSGAVLTSFVGVNGLVRRMTLDRCLPQLLLHTNRRGTTHRILILFFLLCVSVLFITRGDIQTLAGVYTISFLSVMAFFGIGNVLLKVKRATLPRPERARWTAVLIGIGAVLAGLAGNILADPEYVKVFLQYFIPAVLVVFIMLERVKILYAFLFLIEEAVKGHHLPLGRLSRWAERKMEEINSQQFVFFTRGHNVAHLNRAMLYVMDNEDTNRLKVVIAVQQKEEVPARLETDLQILDEAYPEVFIEFVVLEGRRFSPELVQELSREWKIPVNFMFIGSPSGSLPYNLNELGGVRLII